MLGRTYLHIKSNKLVKGPMWERRWNDYNLFKVKRFEFGSPSRVNLWHLVNTKINSWMKNLSQNFRGRIFLMIRLFCCFVILSVRISNMFQAWNKIFTHTYNVILNSITQYSYVNIWILVKTQYKHPLRWIRWK